jgi:hypothetical protein
VVGVEQEDSGQYRAKARFDSFKRGRGEPQKIKLKILKAGEARDIIA